jgi:hypothetical protein
MTQRLEREKSQMGAVHDATIGVTKPAEQQRQADEDIRDVGHRNYHLTIGSQCRERPA